MTEDDMPGLRSAREEIADLTDRLLITNVIDSKMKVLDGKEISVQHYRSIEEIGESLRKATGGWPRVAGGIPFVAQKKPGGVGKIRYLVKTPGLFAWMQEMCDMRWFTGPCVSDSHAPRTPVNKDEFFQHLKDSSPQQYMGTSPMPHYPELPGIYYLAMPPVPGNPHETRFTGRLEEFVASLNPETEEDRDLLRTLIVTLAWGGEAGTRPAFVLASRFGKGCVAGETLVYDASSGSHRRIDSFTTSHSVMSVDPDTGVAKKSHATSPFLKGKADLFEVRTEGGKSILVTDQHRFLTPNGWRTLSNLRVGVPLATSSCLPGSSWGTSQPESRSGEPRYFGTPQDSLDRCSGDFRPCDGQLPAYRGSDPASSPSPDGALGRTRQTFGLGGQGNSQERIRPRQWTDRPSRSDSSPAERQWADARYRTPSSSGGCAPRKTPSSLQLLGQSSQIDTASPLPPSEHPSWKSSTTWDESFLLPQGLRGEQLGENTPSPWQPQEPTSASHTGLLLEHNPDSSSEAHASPVPPANTEDIVWERIASIKFVRHDDFYDMHVPGLENYLANGFWNHNTGKSATAEAICEIWGGSITVNPKDDPEQVRARLLDDGGLEKRTIFMDNLKGRLSGGTLESMLTRKTIDGKRMYHGQFSRPNFLTWVLTSNTPKLSEDMAVRSVIIMLGKQKHEKAWVAWASTFIREHRWAIIHDCLVVLRGPVQSSVAPENRDRYQAWQEECLARCSTRANAIARLLADRRGEANADSEDADEVATAIDDYVRTKTGRDPHKSVTRITREDMHKLMIDKGIVGHDMSKKGVHTWLSDLRGSASLTGLIDSRTKTTRVWIWNPSGLTDDGPIPI